MWIKKEVTGSELGNLLWSGAKEKWREATDAQRRLVLDRVEDCFEYDENKPVNLTSINDLIWFDCDDIFFKEDETYLHQNSL